MLNLDKVDMIGVLIIKTHLQCSCPPEIGGARSQVFQSEPVLYSEIRDSIIQNWSVTYIQWMVSFCTKN